MSMKKRIITFIIGIEAVIIAAVAVFLFYINSDTVRVNRQLELAQRYLLEEDYEQAVAAFEIVIGIDPKNVNAYLGLAEAYAATDDLENAVKVLEKASRRIDSEEVLEQLEIHTAEIGQRELAAQRAAEAAALASSAAVGNTTDNVQQDTLMTEISEYTATESAAHDGELEVGHANEPYHSYLKILQDNRWQILKYSRFGSELGMDTIASIACYDIVGDEKPELIYVSITPETLDWIEWKASLNIVTWQNGQAKLIYTGDWDYNAESGVQYFLFYEKDNKILYSYENYGGWERHWRYCKFSSGENFNIRKETILEERHQYDGWNWSTDYTCDGKSVSQDEYQIAEYELLSKADVSIIASNCFIPNVSSGYYNEISANGIRSLGNQAMTYEEAIDYLEGFLDENEKIWQQGESFGGDWISDESFMRITNIKGSHFGCQLSIYRLYSFDFEGLCDSNGHATLYDERAGVYGEITMDAGRAVVTLHDVPYFYFGQSLSEFMGTQYVFQKQE